MTQKPLTQAFQRATKETEAHSLIYLLKMTQLICEVGTGVPDFLSNVLFSLTMIIDICCALSPGCTLGTHYSLFPPQPSPKAATLIWQKRNLRHRKIHDLPKVAQNLSGRAGIQTSLCDPRAWELTTGDSPASDDTLNDPDIDFTGYL